MAMGYLPSKQARHRLSAGTCVASVSPSMDTKPSESAPIERQISSTVRPGAISSARVEKSMP